MTCEMERKLQEMYRRWLQEMEISCPKFFEKDETYSNPYYSSIPAGWNNAVYPRIMVVGEEGFGTRGCGRDQSILANEIERIQSLNFEYLKKQLYDLPVGEVNNSAFWRRFRRVSQCGVCCWTNIDKIHILRKKRCALSEKDRKLLHSVPTKVLREEIEILNPTHVIFFGWHGSSLQKELPELYSFMYPDGPKDNHVWKKNVVSVWFKGRNYIFTYHPNWGYRNAGYEDKVVAELKKACESLAVGRTCEYSG